MLAIIIGASQTNPNQQQAILLMATWAGVLLVIANLVFMPVVLRRQNLEEPELIEPTNAGIASETSQLLVCGPEEILITLQQDPRLTLLLNPVSLSCFRVAPPEAEPIILAHDLGIVTISWDAALTEAIFGAYAAAVDEGNTQAEKALSALSAADELTERLRVDTAELATAESERQDLGAKLAAVRTRHRGASSVDFSLMTEDGLRKEREGVLKQLRTIDDVLRQKQNATAGPGEQPSLPLTPTPASSV